MKKLLTLMLVLSVGILGIAGESEALVFDLNCVISGSVGGETFSGSPTCGIPTNPVSFGTMTISDNGDSVDISVDLAGNDNIIHRILFNYDDSMFENSTPFSISKETLGVDENNQKPDGYGGSKLDLVIPDGGNISANSDPFSATISLTSVNLDPSDFDFKNNNNDLFAAVHIGNYDGMTPGQSGLDSIWVGATSVSVPESSSLFLLATGLCGLYGVRKKYWT